MIAPYAVSAPSKWTPPSSAPRPPNRRSPACAARQRTTTSFALFDDVHFFVNWLSVAQSDDLRAHIYLAPSPALSPAPRSSSSKVIVFSEPHPRYGIMYQIRPATMALLVCEIDQKQFPDELRPRLNLPVRHPRRIVPAGNPPDPHRAARRRRRLLSSM